MSRPTREELEGMRQDGLSPDLRESFAASERRVAEWVRSRPKASLDDLLDWIDQLRSIFGEPVVDRRPWVGSDFRL